MRSPERVWEPLIDDFVRNVGLGSNQYILERADTRLIFLGLASGKLTQFDFFSNIRSSVHRFVECALHWRSSKPHRAQCDGESSRKAARTRA